MKIPQKTSLVEYHKILRDQETPAQRLKRELSELTMKSPNTVAGWFSGKTPDVLTQRIVADYLGSTPDEVFPKQSNDNGNSE